MSEAGAFTAPHRLPAWAALAGHARRLAARPLSALFVGDPARAARLSLHLDAPSGQRALVADCSKQRLDDGVLVDLFRLAREARLDDGIRRLFAGEAVNFTENRAAAHMAMRGGCPPPPGDGGDTRALRAFVLALRRGALTGGGGKPLRRLINLGIGGSDLGPRLAVEALATPGDDSAPQVDFVANIDPRELDAVLVRADAATTLFVVSSKSFGTEETLANAEAARRWLRAMLGERADLGAHFAAVSNAAAAATAFGILPERIFPLPEWIGGRYSVWSATGLPLLAAIGETAFDTFLAGGRAMDEHFRSAPFERNLPVRLGLCGLWNASFLHIPSLAALPYAHGLRSFPAWLQQLEMESNGKRTLRDGHPSEAATAPIVWGGTGTVGQHTFHQLLYQGTHAAALDFIVPVGDDEARQRALVDNAFAQAAALMAGRDLDAARAALARRGLSAAEIERLAPHLTSAGGQPSTTLLLPRLDAFHLGVLLALYEHKVFVEGWIWGINPFDQYGVELGKDMARALAAGQAGAQDASTARLARLAEAFRQAGRAPGKGKHA
ncbi:MAG: glucose-6-phosphate isomerase [Azoarcus sp.]|jgi:glucose-6-phosphate isomerase|nr:glucose-6-phosphate isomerase [Azoarcus sp.]